MYVRTEVSVEEDNINLMKETVSKFGKIDVLFVNAGIGDMADVEDVTVKDWNRTKSVDLTGLFLSHKDAIAEMRKSGGGSIINCASNSGTRGPAVRQRLCCRKRRCVVNLTRSLAVENAKYNIRVNAVCPGYVLTDICPD